MQRRTSLLLKLSLAFIFIVVVAVGMVAYVARQSATSQFTAYVHRGGKIRAEQLAPYFAEFYAERGDWKGVDDLFERLPTCRPKGFGKGPSQSGGDASFQGGLDRIVLTDLSGFVVADSSGELTGDWLSAQVLSGGAPVKVGERQVGFLLVGSSAIARGTLETEYLRTIDRAILWAGVVSGSIALLLGLILFRQLTRPLRALTEAARRIAVGQRGMRVEVRTDDEIGELAHAFNMMSEALERHEELQRNLMADVAHELRTPLSVIRGNTEALLDGVYEPTPENIAVIHEQSLLLGRLVDDLRELALAEAKQLKLDRRPIAFMTLITPVLNGFQSKAQEKGVELRVDVPDNIPPVFVDTQRIRQVLSNLIDNALRYTPSGGLIEITTRFDDQQIWVRVRDTGPGIAPEDLPRVFDRFYRADKSRTRAGGGSGLGLTIAKQLVEAHGGEIRVHSVFTFTLPRSGPQTVWDAV